MYITLIYEKTYNYVFEIFPSIILPLSPRRQDKMEYKIVKNQ
jgi:hypothetical protein